MTTLLLVGAGHGHLYVMNHARELAAEGYHVHLLAPRFFDYSGVASATAAGTVARDTGRVDVQALAARNSVEHHVDTLALLDLAARVARTAAGLELAFDVVSLNIGSVVAETGTSVHPSVVRVKPLSGLADLDARLRATSGSQGAVVAVVGGGATGVELAAHLAVRPDVALVRLVESAPAIGGGLPAGARRRLEALLSTRRVEVQTGRAVREIGEHRLVCEDASELTYDVAVLATGLSAPTLVAAIGLGDERGVPVRDTLQHVSHDDVYAVGDCARFLPVTLPRIGVHGVRQGPVLLQSLLARARGDRLPVYEPQRRALSILDLGGGTALAVRGRWWWFGAGALRLKELIDRRWLATYRDAEQTSLRRGEPSSGRDAGTRRVPRT
ncbi:NAD(P)/FAD-dependent oxidoreductase [Sanguibacter antarcticus]|uniref:NADH dehydrogenase FAD-containing subunit n=1 Tax=Sanguibacter antarcticus TaxID=372484 RepID=A0A2A9E1P4_9MICO|nr:FAD-dependent oxidoreductase [Sanguibacter antarcticus]PFG32868.1 NADH dehydrogenase FAD-containing subunit [Sanguibacter antarcticus]